MTRPSFEPIFLLVFNFCVEMIVTSVICLWDQVKEEQEDLEKEV